MLFSPHKPQGRLLAVVELDFYFLLEHSNVFLLDFGIISLISI